MIATSESETEALAHERTPLLLCSPSPIISTGTSTDDDGDSEDLKPVVGPELGLPETGNDVVACVKSRHDEDSSKGFGSVVAVMLLGVFISSADNTLILATSGTISSELGNLENQSWLVVSYSFAICAIQPAYGKLSDIYGRKAVLIAAYVLFAIGTALSGLGRNLWEVVAARAVCGMGGAGMQVIVSILIADTVPLRKVATWRGIVNVASTIGRSSGGPIGGYLSDTIGWRWSFLIQCPLALVAILLVAWKLEGPRKLLPGYGDGSEKRKLSRVDFPGTVTLAVTITSFLIALDIGGQKVPWTHPLVWILFSLSAVFGICFVFVERYVAREPIFPLHLLVHPDFVVASLVGALQVGAQLAVMFIVPLYFQVTARSSVMNAGFRLLPAVAGNAIAGIMSGIYIQRTGTYKALTLVGLIVSIIGYILLSTYWHGHTNFWESLYIAPGAFGTGVIGSSLFVYLAAGVDESQMAIASTGLYLSQNIGALLGVSLASNVLFNVLRKGLKTRLDGFPDKEMIIHKAVSNLDYVKNIEGPIRDIVIESYIEGFVSTHYISFGFSLLAFIVALTMRIHDLG